MISPAVTFKVEEQLFAIQCIGWQSLDKEIELEFEASHQHVLESFLNRMDLPIVEALTISVTGTAFDLTLDSRWTKLKNLKSLEIQKCTIKNIEMLNEIVSLNDLTLVGCTVSCIEPIEHIKSVSLIQSRFDLNLFVSLQDLSVQHSPNDRISVDLNGLDCLKSLQLEGVSIAEPFHLPCLAEANLDLWCLDNLVYLSTSPIQHLFIYYNGIDIQQLNELLLFNMPVLYELYLNLPRVTIDLGSTGKTPALVHCVFQTQVCNLAPFLYENQQLKSLSIRHVSADELPKLKEYVDYNPLLQELSLAIQDVCDLDYIKLFNQLNSLALYGSGCDFSLILDLKVPDSLQYVTIADIAIHGLSLLDTCAAVRQLQFIRSVLIASKGYPLRDICISGDDISRLFQCIC